MPNTVASKGALEVAKANRAATVRPPLARLVAAVDVGRLCLGMGLVCRRVL